MKLVEILAKELTEWPSKAEFATQDKDGEVRFMGGCGIGNDFYLSVLADYDDSTVLDGGMRYAGEVTEAQWQAERDRQKGGEWKRHRGGDQPKSVSDGEVVEVRLRSGDIQEAQADDFIWNHGDCDESANITQYRVISQPQAEEVEVKPELTYKLDWVEVDDAKIDQIDGPLKWRDEIIELEAHEEDIQREIASLHKRLTDEGFQLVRQYPSAQDGYPAIDMTYWGNWKAGDVVECTESSCDNVYTVGNYYKVAEVTKEYARVADDCGPESYCHISDSEDVAFILSR